MTSLGIASGKFIWPKAPSLIVLDQSPMYKLLCLGYRNHRVDDLTEALGQSRRSTTRV